MSAREIGIPWSDPMVLSLLARRKTVTRRMIKPPAQATRRGEWQPLTIGGKGTRDSQGRPVGEMNVLAHSHTGYCFGPRYRVGDHIWGREAWGVAWSGGWVDGFTLCYRADKAQVPFFPPKHSMPNTIGKIKTLHEKWRPPMFMPRWASRLLHRVLDVRPERLLAITRDDAIAEGLEQRPPHGNWFWPGGVEGFGDPRTCYLRGYDTLHPDAPSKLNPWVWRIAFEPVEVKHV